ncbi:MAG: 30S ribosomal protein S6--L-glutamate ligase [Actinomycetota bacterium]|nr:30S ribosomal protein S6--L-glutamate ligase [Actinomycetota bacterium]MDA3013900.1 30S ribosomal protein S6--L-glutamate ligase [Actinomycetota bacterium]
MRLGILSQDISLYSTNRLYESAKNRGHETDVVSYLRCYMNIAKANPRVFFKGRELSYDVVIPRIAATWTFYGAAVVRQFELMGALSANSSASISRSRDKLRALQLIGNSGVEMPVTGYVHLSRDIESVLMTVGRPPYVIKLLEGTQGRGVVLTETMEAAVSAIETMKKIDANILIQEFISEAKGEDIRAIVVGDNVVASMKRKAKPGEFRSNVHLGGSVEGYKLTEEEEKSAIKAAKVLGLSVAGVDLIQSSRGPLILEVNSSPGLEGIERASGIDVAGKIVDYLEDRHLNRDKSAPIDI